MTLNEKVDYKTVIECGKRCQNIFIGLKKTCLGVFRIEEIRDKDNETGLKEGRVIKNRNYSAPLRDARSIRFVFLLTTRQYKN